MAVLGSTGSVGTQTLDVACRLGIKVDALAASTNTAVLEEQIRCFRPALCAVADEEAAKRLKTAVSDTPVKIIAGPDSASEAAAGTCADTVVNAIIGMKGLRPTLAAINAHKNVALANKETLVAAGDLVLDAARRRQTEIIPVDSEHCAIMQCLGGNRAERLILTASGGPFFGMNREQLAVIKPKDALRHPTWSMGAKITIDSATLMNKGLEVIEAAKLFDMPASKIDVVIHRESIIHSMVEYIDKAIIAQLSVPDMRMCISYALSQPQRLPTGVESLNLIKTGKLTFFEPDTDTFILLPLAYYALERGGTVPAVMNAANEAAVGLFLEEKIGFCDIFDVVDSVTRSAVRVDSPGIDDIEKADAAAREAVYAALNIRPNRI
ncbi:MAG: 1-deoxy-D-xylulose-5-phosphate reductoisomerase [Eubacteriales bacterium]|nr:1-deoxy-D-xylulose-5-phosphate reductoisomerase [Eubacteriales bacterium]